jgi:sarcosine oxidase subunit beta
VTTADVIVVGAGVIGASCAFHLARAGLRVVVLEGAAAPGAGSTSRATGGFRAQYATAINVRLSLLARERLRAFFDDTGVDSGFAPVGYLWLAMSPHELAALAEANELQRREGLTDAAIVDPATIAEINPYITIAGIIGGAWCPSDGVMRPMDILHGYLGAAAYHGVEIHWGEPVVALTRDHDRIIRVVTTKSSYASALVVDAAGAWAASVARLARVDVPVVPLRRQVALTETTDALPGTFPMTIWLDDGFHLRVRDHRALLLRPTPGDPADPWSDRVEPAWLDDIAGIAPRRVPALRDVHLDRAGSWAGLYEMSPDGHAILGFAPRCANLLLVNGSSGHGVMHAPALGLLLSEIVTGAKPSLDVHALRPSRFAEGQPIVGSSLL